MYITDYQEGNLQALFVDKETGEDSTINDNELSASTLPLCRGIGFIYRKARVEKAIKNGPSAVSTLIRSS